MNFKGFGIQKQDVNVTANRHKYVGGSDVPTILGINPYKSQYELAREKTGIAKKEFITNSYIQFGNQLEPQIRAYINAIYGMNFITETYVNDEIGIRSNVDGIDIDKEILLEIKTHGKQPKQAVYEAQMQLYLYQAGVDKGWLAMYERPDDFDMEFDDERLVIKEIQYDADQIADILDAIETFWIRCEYLKDNPTMDKQEYMTVGTDMDKTVARLHQLGPTIAQMKQALNEKEQLAKDLKQELYEKMTENNIKKMETPLLIVTRVLPSKSKRFNSKAFKQDHAELYEQYQTESKRSGYVKLTVKETDHAS